MTQTAVTHDEAPDCPKCGVPITSAIYLQCVLYVCERCNTDFIDINEHRASTIKYKKNIVLIPQT